MSTQFTDDQGRCLVPFEDILRYFAERAKEALPQANGRVEKALEIALDARNIVELKDTGYQDFLIRSQNGGSWYRVTPQGCECPDYKFNGGPCKHMLARWLIIRAQQADGTRPNARADEERREREEALPYFPTHPGGKMWKPSQREQSQKGV